MSVSDADRDPEPRDDPEVEASDPHTGPLDSEDDARFLDPSDPRRRQVEADRGRPFRDDEEGDTDYDWMDPTQGGDE